MVVESMKDPAIYCLSRDRIGRIYKCLLLFFQTLLGAGHTMHICTAIETGDQHYNRSYGMSCLKYDNVMAIYRIYIAFSYHQFTLITHTGNIYLLALKLNVIFI